jgi:hypothetical protein
LKLSTAIAFIISDYFDEHNKKREMREVLEEKLTVSQEQALDEAKELAESNQDIIITQNLHVSEAFIN